MKYRVVLCLIFITLITLPRASAKSGLNEADFAGQIIDIEKNKPIEFATITIPDVNMWGVTDAQGRFVIKAMPKGKYKYEISVLGYQKNAGEVKVEPGMKTIVFNMQPLNLSLKEVTVTAQAQKLGSSSIIDQTAVKHIQPKSLEDLFQLLPGNITKNPNLNSVGQAYIREISSNDNNALGTLVVVDGAPLSNDANLQLMTTAKSNTGADQSTAGKGVDLRTVSPDNIESVEVIRGIPSVEYGNLTSGAVIVKTRAGATPWEAKLKADPYSKMVYVGKGFILSEKAGTLSLSGDYSQSYDDIRQKYKGFDRITANAAYHNVFMNNSTPLSFDVKAAFFSNINNEKSDPELKTDEKINNKFIGLRLSLHGNWALRKSWITNLDYSAMLNYSKQEDYRKQQVILQSGITPVGNATTSSEYQTFFLNQSYYTEYTINGKPLDLFLQLKANKMFRFGTEDFMNIKLGVEWRYNKNYGDGMVFDAKYPPQITNNQAIRPRAYNTIPALSVGSLFIEDKARFTMGKTNMTIQAGVRLSDLFVDAIANRDNIFTVEPRINIDYNILNKKNNSIFDDFSIVGGYGIATKAPTLMQLYPDRAYFDVTSMALMFKDDTDGSQGKSMAVMTTKVIDDTSNPRLKPTYSYKAEGGISFKKNNISATLTFFNEEYKNEYTFSSRPVAMPYNKYTVPTGVDAVKYNNGMVSYLQNGAWSDATVKNDTLFFSYRTPQNGVETTKRGVEYSFNLGQIPYIKTSLVVDGAWLYIKRRSTVESYTTISDSYQGGNYPLMAVNQAGSGTISNRINTNFRFITHIPMLKMVFSTTLQVIWHETYQNIYQDAQGNDLYYRMKDPFSQTGAESWFVNPAGFIDYKGDYTRWQPGMENDSKYRYMLQSYSHDNYFGVEKLPITAILNFRLTKEFGNIMELSFMANNFLKISKSHKNTTTVGWRDLTIPMYFGAEVKIKL
ncbi:MAG: TonB-dependent receptor [Muribaculaceae bacterium]|nr:TonB-dependent receptor [Muribaculaceae bacterium]